MTEEGRAIVAALNSSLGGKIDQVAADVRAVNSKVDKAVERIDKHDERLDRQDARLDHLEAQAAAKSNAPEASSTASVSACVTPKELRTIAVMGNLVWDTPRQQLMERAAEILGNAVVSSDSYKHVCPMTNREGKGSSVQLAFNQPADLQHAALAVGSLHSSFSQDRYVWLDAKQEKGEARPRIVCIRMGEFLEDVEASREAPGKVEVFRNGKFVKVGGTRVGFT